MAAYSPPHASSLVVGLDNLELVGLPLLSVLSATRRSPASLLLALFRNTRYSYASAADLLGVPRAATPSLRPSARPTIHPSHISMALTFGETCSLLQSVENITTRHPRLSAPKEQQATRETVETGSHTTVLLSTTPPRTAQPSSQPCSPTTAKTASTASNPRP